MLAVRVDRRGLDLVGAGFMIVLHGVLAAAVALGIGTVVAIVVIMPLTAAVRAVLAITVDANLERIVDGPDFPLARSSTPGRSQASRPP